MPEDLLNRRHFIYRAGGAVAGAAGISLVDACSSHGSSSASSTTTAPTATGGGAGGGSTGAGGSSSTASITGGAPTLPTYVAFDQVTADLPALDNGTPSGFLTYPATPPKLYDSAPGTGGSISILQKVLNAVAPPVGKNPFLQKLNSRLGVDLKFTQYDGAANYGPKFATTIAGGDLPDVTTMVVSAHFAELLESRYQELSPWLAGDAVKNFPSLAAIQPTAWPNMVYNGGLYGLPYALHVAGGAMTIRQDIADDLGLSTDLSSGQDFIDLCKALTDVKANKWAITDPINSALPFVMEMVEAPNGWKEEGGKFTNAYETDEYKRGLGIMNQIWQAGYIEPDALSASTSAFEQWFASGRAAIAHISYTAWPAWLSAAVDQNPKAKIGGLLAPKWDGGGQAGHYLVPGYFQFIGLKKGSKSRIEEVLRVLDYLAAPFGSQEYLFVNYGISGVDYTLRGSDPIETKTGISEAEYLNAGLLVCGDTPIYAPGQQDVTKASYDFMSKLMDVTVPLPTNGLYSETNIGVGATINKAVTDLRTDIILGRKPLSAWDAAMKTWRSAGGDKIRSEYEESFADAH